MGTVAQPSAGRALAPSNAAAARHEDVQFAVSGGTRKVLEAFRANSSTAGFVAVYSGN